MLFVLIDKISLSDRIKRIFEILGNLTYSMYLIHTVSFLYFLYILEMFDKISFFNTNFSFFLYLFITILLSLFSFYFIERPLNMKIRNKFLD